MPQPPASSRPDRLSRIAEREPQLRAWAHLAETDWPQAWPARVAGTVSGLPFGVKDVIDVAGMPTRCGAQASDAGPRAFDAACVSALRAAGAVPVGKTVTAEYAFRTPGPTCNPHAPAHTPGGSSSGSAAAVAAGMVPFALSTQTGGSIVRPAAYCGVVGFKPTFGLVSRAGLASTCDSLDVIGWHADSVATATQVGKVLLPAVADGAAPLPALPGLRVAVVDWSPAATLSADGAATLARAADRLRALGARCETRVPQAALRELMAAHDVLMHYEFARNLAPVARRAPDGVSAVLREAVTHGLAIDGAQYRAALAVQRRLRTAWSALAGDADLVLTPSVPGAAPAGIAHTGSPAFAKPWSVLGWPCLHLPLGKDATGLPLGVQLVADWENDFTLLAWGERLHHVLFNEEK
ncbi:amidase [Orrella dioscoreae]|uniref:Aspartyl-tRNA(Asn) amidotransferase subunit A @ Glutamyl-tRNA(Gln) amidotransferase subunit A n=1 Tax=Orrella dioscoreae TaxID=1851544 RepID=A0A1C3K3I7_9BURK|nr:amidase [Orrella dioscoreae]SBT25998.1 Aspartyl-tRNA(Asn) amidotransferase subunit A @ Glutamyl-tRNA(Gln) amidotransferase subunit A [Orrella dioscoreae]SOE46162.1 Aspartyl-tRNA(Asn) amidotransferase subunit A @ Glutamyl-tRNA(Gln) amidotransferase subunit A [Orrella dioscoreae]